MEKDKGVYLVVVVGCGWVAVYGSVVEAGVDISYGVLTSICESSDATELVTCAVGYDMCVSK